MRREMSEGDGRRGTGAIRVVKQVSAICVVDDPVSRVMRRRPGVKGIGGKRADGQRAKDGMAEADRIVGGAEIAQRIYVTGAA